MNCNGERRVDISQNVAWTLQRGSWAIHVLVLLLLKLTLSAVFGGNIGWQLSLIIYNLGTFIFFHLISGDPFCSKYDICTFWEQLSEQLEDSSGLIFIALFPLVSFIIINLITVWHPLLFWICVASLVLVIIPKLGFMHLRRILIVRE